MGLCFGGGISTRATSALPGGEARHFAARK
jgi:hypothetical protein